MGKNSRRRREEKAKKNKPIETPLSGHHRVGRKLIPPLNRLPNMQHSRWSFERMPELLWASLVRAVLPRSEALQIFRRIAKEFRTAVLAGNFTSEQSLPSHTNLQKYHPQLIPVIVATVVAHPLGYAALRLLSFFEHLPARDEWLTAINAERIDGDLDVLADAVAQYLWHQSEPATDVRWFCVTTVAIAGKFRFPEKLADRVESLRLFPDHGDMRQVRPFIRSTEMVLWVLNEHDFKWSESFWRECHEKTLCIPGEAPAIEPPIPESQEVGPLVTLAINEVAVHWIATAKTTEVDPVHEGAFGFVLYALRALVELVGRTRQRIAGRLLLRTIVECRITLAYLMAKNDPALWAKYRHYGSGQAKLALLKIAEAAQPPHSVSSEILQQIANEDVWQEYVDIELGHWAGADLRKMAEESGTKDVYDAQYGWNSGFVHGQWAAVRDTALTTCLNPLHRLHRIPLNGLRDSGDTFPDARTIVQGMITDLSKLYPGLDVDLFRAPSQSAPGEAEAPFDTAGALDSRSREDAGNATTSEIPGQS